MKKAFLFLFLAIASGVSFAQTSIQGREFSVRAYGAKGDNSTNDTAAFAAAAAAVNASRRMRFMLSSKPENSIVLPNRSCEAQAVTHTLFSRSTSGTVRKPGAGKVME